MRSAVEEQIAHHCRLQLGHITRAQLLGAGLSRSGIWRREASGLLVRRGSKTFRDPAVPLTEQGEVMAACLDRNGVASHRTAGWLHGLCDRGASIDLTVRKGRSMSVPPSRAIARPIRVHSSTNLPAADVLVVGSIPSTSVARTCLGLGALVPGELTSSSLLEIVSRAIDEGLAREPWLWWLLDERRCRGRNGVVALEHVLATRSALGPTESWLEREVLRLLGDASLPLPRTQRVVRRSGRFAARVDFLYEAESIVLEALGYGYHRTPSQMEADTRRANRLQLLGYEVYQFTARQIAGSPDSLPQTVEAALHRARALAR
ncbi:hypothetical protein BH23ACT2_BH23ACT2_05170 [soil metagenome]